MWFYLVDAASLIKRLLTVNPAKRANIIDVAAHWWTNHEQQDLLAELELCADKRRTSDYFDEEEQDCRVGVAAFDSNKKPKKSILKNRKISGGDSGCALSDPKECEISLASLASSLDEVNPDSKSNKPTQCVRTMLLKEDTTPTSSKRHSLSSNSSTDMLDFSYDSSSSTNCDSSPVCCEVDSSTITKCNQSKKLTNTVTSNTLYICSV